MMELFNQMLRMDRMIRAKCTGTPAEFACRIGVSVRTLYNYLAMMKELGAPIHYSRTGCTYKYSREGQFFITFSDRISKAA